MQYSKYGFIGQDEDQKVKTYRFSKGSPDGKEFIMLWNKGNRDGLQPKLAKHFKVSVATISRVRRKLELEPLHSGKHPGRQKLMKSIKKMYVKKGQSTLWIGKYYRMCSQNINKILREMGVEIREEQYVTNPLYFKTRIGHSPGFLVKEIKRMYTDENMTCAQIAKELQIDQSTVSTKLYAMGVRVLRQNHQPIKGGYKCQWCGQIMETVWQNKGPRKQKFCGSKCSSKAKDYRRKERYGENRTKMMEDFLKETWGTDYQNAVNNILKVKQVIQ
jgi:transposase